MIDFLAIGDSSIDFFMGVDPSGVSEYEDSPSEPKICFIHGSKIKVNEFGTSIAGNAINVAVGCAKLGLKSSVYTEIGDDQYAQRIITEMSALGMNTNYCSRNPGKNTNLHAIIGYAGERTIFSYHEKMHYALKDWPTPKWLFYTSMSAGFEAFQEELINYCKKNKSTGMGVIYSPGIYQMSQGQEVMDEFLAITDLTCINKDEAQKLSEMEDEDDIEKLLEGVAAKGPKVVVITDGKRGAWGWSEGRVTHVDPYPNPGPIRDRTGAGDAFAAGFISALHYGKDITTALEWGAKNSAYVMTEIGAVFGQLDKRGMLKLQDK